MSVQCWLRHKQKYRLAFTFCVPLILSILPIIVPGKISRCAYILLVMVIFWGTDVLPLAATGLIPAFAFPMLGILSTREVCNSYFTDATMFFLGGLIVAVAVEYSQLHKRIALFMMLGIGQSPKRLLFSLMTTQLFLSLWIANTAATAMITPIVQAILDEYESEDSFEEENYDPSSDANPLQGAINLREYKAEENSTSDSVAGIQREVVLCEDEKRKSFRRMAHTMYLGAAYASNIGGTGTMSGAMTNMILVGFLERTYPDENILTYSTWMFYSIPGAVVCAAAGYLWLCFLMKDRDSNKAAQERKSSALRKLLETKYRSLGDMSYHEWNVSILFFLLVLLWLFLRPGYIEGWGAKISWFYGDHIKIGPAVPAIFVVLLLFILPAKNIFSKEFEAVSKDYDRCLTWEAVQQKLPWAVIPIVGGGMALAEASRVSGLSLWMAGNFTVLEVFPKELILLLVTIVAMLTTEMVSNTATISILVPVLNNLAVGVGINPIYLLFPATICCSYAFMLPVATGPNLIIYAAAGDMPTSKMIKVGTGMNLICWIICNILMNTYGRVFFDIDSNPSWANSSLAYQL